MLIFGDPCGQDIRGYCIQYGGEAVGDSPCSGGPLEVIHGAQAEGEGEAAELVIQQYLAEITWLDITEAEGGPGGIAGSVNCSLGIGAEGDGEGMVTQVHSLL
ncbi:hypothetical protein ES703_54448 [subsurface metagenome]